MAIEWKTGKSIGEFESLVFPKNVETPQENRRLPSPESSLQESSFKNQNPEEQRLLNPSTPRINRLFRPS
jgi:hypothetical protein